MEKGIRHQYGASICPYCRLHVLDCSSLDHFHHDGYGLDWDCRYKGFITAPVSKAFFAEFDDSTLQMLGTKDGITLSDTERVGAWPGEENERLVHEWLGQHIEWFSFKVPRILEVFLRVAESTK
jgi:hypothetical protein